MTSSKIAAIAQLCSTNSKLNNLYNIAKCAGWAKKQGASMLFLPECLGFIGSSAAETLANAEKIPFDDNENSDTFDSDEYGNSARTSTRSEIKMKDVPSSWWCSSLEDVVMKCADTGCYQDHEKTLQDEFGDDTSLFFDKIKCSNNDQVSILHGLRIIARISDLYISAGGIHELGAPPIILISDDDGDDGSTSTGTGASNHEISSSPSVKTNRNRVYNTHLIINNKGEIVTRYRKIHLFDVSIPSKGIHLCESATTAPGKKLVVCDSPVGRLGLSTCYDMRFPEMYQELAGVGGSDILLVPSAFTVPTGKAHWHTLLRARAIENQCYVLAAAQFGKHNEKRKSYGHAIAIDPWGEVIADAGGYDSLGIEEPPSSLTPKIILCDIHDDGIKSTRERMPIRSHRKSCQFSW